MFRRPFGAQSDGCGVRPGGPVFDDGQKRAKIKVGFAKGLWRKFFKDFGKRDIGDKNGRYWPLLVSSMQFLIV